MIRYICSLYFSDKEIMILSDCVPHHTIACELLDTDNSRVCVGKREDFSRKCFALAKSLKSLYPHVVMKKERIQVLDIK